MKKGATVKWNWGKGKATGKVKEKFTGKVTRNIKGAKVTRHASKKNPAYLIEQKDGGKVLKSETEVKEASE